MSCKEFEKQIVLFTELTNDEQAKVTDHLKTCARCSELFASVTNINNLVGKVGKVNVEIEDPFRLTNDIMARIKREETKRWSLFDISFPIFEFNSMKFGMTAVSFALVVLFGAEQMKGTYRSSETQTGSSRHQENTSAVNTKAYQNELIKSKVTAKFFLTNNCISPFNINKVNITCLKQKALHKEI